MQRLHQERLRPTGARAAAIGGGGARRAANDKAQKILRAFDIQTGKVVWELPQDGPAETWSGTLSTASGLVFYGDDGGELAAADAVTGKKLWSFPFTDSLHTSPMTYMFDNKQYVGLVVGSQVYVFGLPTPSARSPASSSCGTGCSAPGPAAPPCA